MSFYGQYLTLAVLVVVAAGFYAMVVTVNRLMRPSFPSPSKLTTYECGVDPAGSGWTQMNIRYYVFAFLFVIFDVESVFLFPWAIVLDHFGETPGGAVFPLIQMFVFIGVLALGLVYAWRKGVLTWD